MNDKEAYEFYANPENLKIAGPAHKRQGQRLTTMSSVRFAPEVIEAVKDLAFKEGITVGSWIRRLVQREIEPPRMVEVDCDGLDEPLRVPQDALERIVWAAMPAIIRHGSVNLQLGAGPERPTGLIEEAGRKGEPRSLPSSLRLKPRTFSCPHMSVGNAVSVTCETCGPLEAAA